MSCFAGQLNKTQTYIKYKSGST